MFSISVLLVLGQFPVGERFPQQLASRFSPVNTRALAFSGDRLVHATDALFDGDRLLTRLPAPALSMTAAKGALWIVTGHAVLRWANQRLETSAGFPAGVRQIAGHGDRLAAATATGVHERTGTGPWTRVTNTAARGVAYDSKGRLWLISEVSLERRNPDGSWTPESGLPVDGLTTLAITGEDSVWIGTSRGAVRFDGKNWEYRQGRRWLPADDVRAIAVSGDSAWFATAGGIGRIETKLMTLGEKARFYEEEIDKRHRRTPYGFVLEVALKQPGDTREWIQHDSDNDGLWTAMYGAGECFAYAATKDPYFRERAARAFRALKFLGDVTQGGTPPARPGFVARTVLPASGGDPNLQPQYTPEGDRRRRERDSLWKVLTPRWGKSAGGQWYWKTDTSSDELDGHYFFYSLYHDLVAQSPEERAAVRQVVTAITDHLLAHDFNLIDHDGTPTRWGVFAPAKLNLDRDWWEERGLNSLSLLTYLKVADSLSADRKYRDAADTLIRQHGYVQNAMYAKADTETGAGNQSDDEMALMNYYNLVRLEKDPRLKQMYARSLWSYWRHERAEMNPFFAFAAEALLRDAVFQDNGPAVKLALTEEGNADGIDTLRRYPLNLLDWRLTNQHRLDLRPLGPGRAVRRNGKVLPADERFFHHWNHDPYRLDTGGQGRSLAVGTPFLLGYYLGLYHGIIR